MSELRLNTDGHIIKFGADNDVSLTHVADTGLTTNATFQATTITATTAVVPDASDGAALGTTALEWSDLFLADGAVINFGDDQDVTLTHVADAGLMFNTTMQLRFRDAAINIGSPADGDLDINADDEIELNSTLIDINGNVEVSGTLTQVGVATFTASLLPATDDAVDLGSASKQWRDVYTGDLNLNNTKHRKNEVDGTSGSWTIQEGSDDLFLLNRINGKKYKFNIVEVK